MRATSHLLPKLTLIFLLSALHLTQEAGEESEIQSPLQVFQQQLKSKVPFCVPGLGNAYGLNGLVTPINGSRPGWTFCPMINSTCCSKEDADSAFSSAMGGLKRLKQHFTVYSKIIDDLLEAFTVARKIASRVNGRLATIKFSNCKVLASKIVLYDIDKVGPQILESIDATYKFMLFSYKGFYCEICNADKNKFIFDADGFVIIHKRQCRENVVGAVKAMYYLRVLLLNFSNLVVKFMNNCDAKGTFFDDVLMSQLVLTQAPDDRLVERCWAERNSPKWLEECKDFCDKFNFVNLNSFFKPYAEKFALITAFLNKRALQMVSQETLDSSINMPPSTGSQGLLEDLGMSQSPPLKFLNAFTEADYQDADQKIKVQIQSMGGSSIITGISGSGTPIDENTYVYMEKGFNFFSAGKETMISTSDDQIDPGTPMVGKDSFEVKRNDPPDGSKVALKVERKLIDSDDSETELDDVTDEELAQAEQGPEVKHTTNRKLKGRHHRRLQSAGVVRVWGVLLAVWVLGGMGN